MVLLLDWRSAPVLRMTPDVDARLQYLAAVFHGHGEGRLVGPRQDHVTVLIERFTRHPHGRDLHPVQGVGITLSRARRRRDVEAERPVIHERLRLFEVGLVPRLARRFEGTLDGRNVKVGDDGVARPVVGHGRREVFFEPFFIPGSRLREIVCRLRPYAQRRDYVVVRVLELGWDLLLLRCLLVLLLGAIGHLGERPVVQLRSVAPGVTQDALEFPPAGARRVAQEAIRARHVLADLGRLLGGHATAGDEKDKPEDHDQEQQRTDQGDPGRKRPAAALLGAAAGSPGTARLPRTTRLRGCPVRPASYKIPPRTCRGRGGTRTPTASRPLDPEPSASTNSATRPRSLPRIRP